MATIMGSVEFYRGDSYPLELTIKNKETKELIDLTGYSFLLTVDSLKTPIDALTKVFEVAGVVDPDQVVSTGKVTFTPTEVQTDITTKKYFYDVQMTDASAHIRTIVKDTFTILQDITK